MVAVNWEILKGTRHRRAVRDVINEPVTCPRLRTISDDVRIKSAASWDVVSCTLVEIYWPFRGLYCLYLILDKFYLQVKAESSFESLVNCHQIVRLTSFVDEFICREVGGSKFHRNRKFRPYCTSPYSWWVDSSSEDGDCKSLRNVGKCLPHTLRHISEDSFFVAITSTNPNPSQWYRVLCWRYCCSLNNSAGMLAEIPAVCIPNDRALTYFPSVQVSQANIYIYICVLFLKSITSLRPLFSDQPPKLYAGSTAGRSMPSAGNLTTTDNEPPNRFANSDVKYCRGQAASGWKLKHSPLTCICMLYRSLKYVEPLQRA